MQPKRAVNPPMMTPDTGLPMMPDSGTPIRNRLVTRAL